MVRPIVHDPLFLHAPSQEATAEDRPLGTDLRDTLTANRDSCVGMAANMIGVRKRVIIFEDEKGQYVVLFNPKILEKSGAYQTEEGCLSLAGVRPTTRYKKIKVTATTEQGKPFIKTFTGFTAQIIQHECDHLEGILI